MDDLQIIQLYWDRDPEAIAQTHQKYGPYCFTLAHRILASREDAEECVNDTWLHAWNGMPPHRPNVLRLFLAKITRRVALNRWKASQAQKRGQGELPRRDRPPRRRRAAGGRRLLLRQGKGAVGPVLRCWRSWPSAWPRRATR